MNACCARSRSRARMRPWYLPDAMPFLSRKVAMDSTFFTVAA